MLFQPLSPPPLPGLFPDRAAEFATDSLDVAIEHLRTQFSPHQLRVTGAPERFAARMSGGRLGGLELSMLSYGTEVELCVETGNDHVLVTTQTAGRTRIRSQGAEAAGGVGLIVLDSTPSAVVKRFSADSCRLNLKIARSHINSTFTDLAGRPPERPIVFHPFVEADALCRKWWSHMGLLGNYLASGSPSSTRLADALVETVLLSLLTEFPHSNSEALRRDDPGTSRASARLARANTIMQDRFREPLLLADIARECAVSVRTLTKLFQDALGVTPMKHLQEIRLQAARTLLQTGTAEWSVTRVAVECGFSGLGRFSAIYRARFGELPSATRSR